MILRERLHVCKAGPRSARRFAALTRAARSLSPAINGAREDHCPVCADALGHRRKPPSGSCRATQIRASTSYNPGHNTRSLASSETSRQMMAWPFVESLVHDGVYGARTMLRTPLFSIVIVALLALGIGTNTAVFTVLDAIVLRDLPVRDPEQLVELVSQYPGEPRMNIFQWNAYEHFRDANRSFSELIGTWPVRLRASLAGVGPEPIEGEYIVGSFFPALGIQPARGRLIGPQDDRLGSPTAAVAVVSWSYSQTRGNLDPSIVGRRIVVSGVPLTVIGVAPPGFFGLQVGRATDVWIPAAAEALIEHPSHRADGTLTLELMGRLKPGVSIDQARAELRVLDRFRVEALATMMHDPVWRRATLDVAPGRAGVSALRDQLAEPLLSLMALVVLLLLITCANVASMMAVRGAARRGEMSLRQALGASRIRLIRQMLTESLLFALAGGALGILVARTSAAALLHAWPIDPRSGIRLADVSINPDLRVLLFTAGVAFVTAVLFGLAPAWHALESAVPSSLREVRAMGEPRSRRLLGKTLIVLQIALSVVLLSAALTLVANVSRLRNKDLGFRRDSILLLTLDPGASAAPAEGLFHLYQDLLRRFQLLPGVGSATLAALTPLQGGAASRFMHVDGLVEDASARRRVSLNWVAPRYFETLGIPQIGGRDFSASDEGGPPVAIVSQKLAQHYFGGANAVGKHFSFDGQKEIYEIVGVVGDAKFASLHEMAAPTVYLHAFQEARGRISRFALRTSEAPEPIAGAVRRTVNDASGRVTIANMTTLAEQVDASIVGERLMAKLSTALGTFGTLLAAMGLYGLIGFTVASRTSEIGTRMALGATNRRVLASVVSDGLKIAALGIVTGNIAAILAAVYVRRWLTVDIGLMTLLWSAALITLVAATASFVPAWRASMLSPMAAIRNEPGSLYRAAARQVTRLVREHLSEEVDRAAAPSAGLLTDLSGNLRAATSGSEATRIALATLQAGIGARSATLLAKGAGDEYRCDGWAIPQRGFLISRLARYPHPLPLREDDFAAWRRWSREFRPEYAAELDALATDGVRIAVPLYAKNDLVGVLLLGSPEDRDGYTLAERQLLSGLASVIALMIENARLTDRAVEQDRLRRDLALAAEVQRRLLPPHPPTNAVATLAAFTLAARTIGGDYYDFVNVDEDRLGIVIADVSGKGIAAALLMSVVQTALRVISSEPDLTLVQLTARMNHVLYQSTSAAKYATFFYARLDRRTGRLRYVNAGHNPPYLMRRDFGALEIIELRTGGTVLGLFPESEYEEGEIQLRAGDLLVAFTDGVPEALNAAGEEFGEERLKVVMQNAAGKPAPDVSSQLSQAVRDWIGSAEQHDDLTFVIATIQ